MGLATPRKTAFLLLLERQFHSFSVPLELPPIKLVEIRIGTPAFASQMGEGPLQRASEIQLLLAARAELTPQQMPVVVVLVGLMEQDKTAAMLLHLLSDHREAVGTAVVLRVILRHQEIMVVLAEMDLQGPEVLAELQVLREEMADAAQAGAARFAHLEMEVMAAMITITAAVEVVALALLSAVQAVRRVAVVLTAVLDSDMAVGLQLRSPTLAQTLIRFIT